MTSIQRNIKEALGKNNSPEKLIAYVVGGPLPRVPISRETLGDALINSLPKGLLDK